MSPSTPVHILNGDALLAQFPETLVGERLVCRECLVVGDLAGETLQEFYIARATWLVAHYGGTLQDYNEKAVTEFEKILALPNGTEINLWFEDDVFCQTNFWFILHLLAQREHSNLFLVRPQEHTQYGFGGFDANGLQELFQQKIQLTQLEVLSSLWQHYKAGNMSQLLATAEAIQHDFPFIHEAVVAYTASIPTEDSLGLPSETIISIAKDLNTEDFGLIFREFCERLPIYGYGDLQVKQLYDALLEKNLV